MNPRSRSCGSQELHRSPKRSKAIIAPDGSGNLRAPTFVASEGGYAFVNVRYLCIAFAGFRTEDGCLAQGKVQGGNRLAVVKSTDSDPVFGLLAVLDSPEYEDKLEETKDIGVFAGSEPTDYSECLYVTRCEAPLFFSAWS